MSFQGYVNFVLSIGYHFEKVVTGHNSSSSLVEVRLSVLQSDLAASQGPESSHRHRANFELGMLVVTHCSAFVDP
jgi:hypothetical protein